MGASSGKNPESSLAAAASERVRAIVEAAEQASAEIRARAEEEANRTRSEAEERASRVRAEAEEGASRVRAEAEQHATGLRAQARTDVHALLDSIRSGMTRLSADLDQLDAKLTGTPAPTADPPASARTTRTAAASAPAPSADTTAPAGSDDEDGARLVALNMALNGKRRDEVEKHLSEHYELSDQASLLDEVFASVEG
jgi:vacuolar-type H+-ATPase subunit H